MNLKWLEAFIILLIIAEVVLIVMEANPMGGWQ